jgi:hypothetical protein
MIVLLIEGHTFSYFVMAKWNGLLILFWNSSQNFGFVYYIVLKLKANLFLCIFWTGTEILWIIWDDVINILLAEFMFSCPYFPD